MAIATDILNAVVSAVQTLNLTDLTVVPRKVPALRQGETPPYCCVSLEDERMEPFTGEDDDAWFVYYPVVVTLIVQSEGQLIPPASLANWRQAIRRKLTQFPELGVSALSDVEYNPRPPFEAGQLDRGYDYSAMGFTYEAIEPRTV